MRGQKLFNDIIKSELPDRSEHKGRSESLLSKRNNCMLARFYYYGEYRRKNYESIIQLMVAEFFLSPERISRIITQNAAVIRKMKEDHVSKYQLQAGWPQFKW
jgi:hypothetical protein